MNRQQFDKLALPDAPGVYLFKQGGEILYIGKATSLRDRVRSYFGADLIETRGPLLVDMVFKADTIAWQEADSVLEALILEANLIKKHQPKYNTREKDDKSFNYVCITKEQIPKVVVMRGRDLAQKKGDIKVSRSFGPFTNGGALREALKIIRRIFPFLDAHSAKKGNYEFYRQIGMAPDASESEFLKRYKENIKNITLFFEGKKSRIIAGLKREMLAAAKRQEFERAGEIKRQIFSLEHIHDIALIKKDAEDMPLRDRGFRIEAYDVAHLGGKSMVGVMTVVTDGVADRGEYRKFKIRTVASANDPAGLTEILERRLGHAEWPLPNLIVVDGNDVQKKTAERVLRERGFSIDVAAVVKDERHRPKNVIGRQGIIFKHNDAILLANHEAHRFSINYYRMLERGAVRKKARGR